VTVDDGPRRSESTSMPTRWAFIFSVAASLIALQAKAHDTWLIANQMRAAPKATVTLDLTSGMAFPAAFMAAGKFGRYVVIATAASGWSDA
jgi:hypothetical protein